MHIPLSTSRRPWVIDSRRSPDKLAPLARDAGHWPLRRYRCECRYTDRFARCDAVDPVPPHTVPPVRSGCTGRVARRDPVPHPSRAPAIANHPAPAAPPTASHAVSRCPRSAESPVPPATAMTTTQSGMSAHSLHAEPPSGREPADRPAETRMAEASKWPESSISIPVPLAQ